MIGKGYEVFGDLLGIAQRIRALDPDYFVFYSYEKKRYEVHCRGQKGSTLAVSLPFDRLDERSFRRVVETRRENSRKLLEKLERDNMLAERESVLKAVKTAEFEAERAFGGKYE